MKNKLKSLIYAVLAALVLSGCTTPCQNQQPDYTKQQEVTRLIQEAMHYLQNWGNLHRVEQPYFKGITLKTGHYNLVETNLSKASSLAPERLDLLFGLASTQIFSKNIEGAQKTYRKILKRDPDNRHALILQAAYAKVSSDTKTFQQALSHLKKINPTEAERYLEKFERAEKIEHMALNTKAHTVQKNNHTIVILGYILSNEGKMQPPLYSRLQQGLAAAKLNPDAKIIVTSGLPKQGVTEAYVMEQWLIKQGIAPERIILEDQSIDTVGNAIYTADILASLGTEHVTLITSASHIRRAILAFEEATKRYNLTIHFNNLVAMDFDSSHQAMQVSADEKLVIYRDMLRASGLWAYPGMKM